MPNGIDLDLQTYPYIYPQDITLAIWKEATIHAPLTVGQTIQVYGTVLTVQSVSKTEIVFIDPDDLRVWSVPSWCWTSSGA